MLDTDWLSGCDHVLMFFSSLMNWIGTAEKMFLGVDSFRFHCLEENVLHRYKKRIYLVSLNVG